MIRKKGVYVGGQKDFFLISVDFMFCHGFAVREEWQVTGGYYL